MKQVRDWLSMQETYTLFKPARVKFLRAPVVVSSLDRQWELDLVEMSHVFTLDGREVTLPDRNDQVRYILMVIDVFSKFAWARGVTSKRSVEVAKAFESILADTAPRIPRTTRSDMGSEFNSAVFKKMLDSHGIKPYYALAETKAAFVERVIKTIKGRIMKYVSHEGKVRYIDVLPDMMEAYNAAVHSATGWAPADIGIEDQSEVEYDSYLRR